MLDMPTVARTESLPLRMDPETREILADLAQHLGCSLNTAAIMCIRKAAPALKADLERRNPEPPPKRD